MSKNSVTWCWVPGAGDTWLSYSISSLLGHHSLCSRHRHLQPQPPTASISNQFLMSSEKNISKLHKKIFHCSWVAVITQGQEHKTRKVV